MARAVVVGVAGDSGAGKTTITRGLTRVLGDSHVTHISADCRAQWPIEGHNRGQSILIARR